MTQSLISVVAKSDTYNNHLLFGELGGGMLEYVKMEEYTNDGEPWVRLYFTNHDVQATLDVVTDFPPENLQHKLVDNQYFIVTIPKYR